jgi:hypothetical protein
MQLVLGHSKIEFLPFDIANKRDNFSQYEIIEKYNLKS